jgi:hypothetical protein
VTLKVGFQSKKEKTHVSPRQLLPRFLCQTISTGSNQNIHSRPHCSFLGRSAFKNPGVVQKLAPSAAAIWAKVLALTH